MCGHYLIVPPWCFTLIDDIFPMVSEKMWNRADKFGAVLGIEPSSENRIEVVAGVVDLGAHRVADEVYM